MAEKDEGLKEGEKTPEKQPDSEKQPAGSEPLKTPEESPSEKAERLLKDGTSPNKEIKVNKKTFDERSEKAKLYEVHAPLLDKVLQNPELVENLLEVKEKGNLDERLTRMEEERKAEKRQEIREVVTDALSQWPDLEKLWSEVQPIVDSLTKGGISYRDALRRGYFAVNPDAASAEKERVAREGVNTLGSFPTNTTHSPKVSQLKEEPKLTEGEKVIAKVLGKSEADYAMMLETHRGWLKEKGFYSE